MRIESNILWLRDSQNRYILIDTRKGTKCVFTQQGEIESDYIREEDIQKAFDDGANLSRFKGKKPSEEDDERFREWVNQYIHSSRFPLLIK